MTVAEIVEKLSSMPQDMEVAVKTEEGFCEIYDFEVSKERSYKLSVDYSGDYHELRELENHEVSIANRVPGIVILKPVDD